MTVNYKNEFEEVAKHIKRLLNTNRVVPFSELLNKENQLMAARVDALRKIFHPETDSIDYERLLSEMAGEAPKSFEFYWAKTKETITSFLITEKPDSAVQYLASLIGWATIEAYWRGLSIVLGPRVRLAGIALDINLELSEEEVINVIRTNSVLFRSLLLDRFEENISGGLKKIADIGSEIENNFIEFQKRLDSSEQVVNGITEKIDGYVSALEKYKIQFAFLGLSAAFRNFFQRKRMENRAWGVGAFILALLMISVAALSHVIAYKLENLSSSQLLGIATTVAPLNTETAKSKGTSMNGELPKNKVMVADKNIQTTQETDLWVDWITKYFPILGFEILLLYFFRFSLLHFNASKAQLLQLEVRMAVCAFIEDYAKFAKENKGQDLSKFESMIFSAIAHDNEKMPSTFDGMDQLATFIKNIKNG